MPRMILETGEGTGNGAAPRGSRFTKGRIQGRKKGEGGGGKGGVIFPLPSPPLCGAFLRGRIRICIFLWLGYRSETV